MRRLASSTFKFADPQVAVVHGNTCLCINEWNAKSTFIPKPRVVSRHILQRFFVQFPAINWHANNSWAPSLCFWISPIVVILWEASAQCNNERKTRYILGIFWFTRNDPCRHIAFCQLGSLALFRSFSKPRNLANSKLFSPSQSRDRNLELLI